MLGMNQCVREQVKWIRNLSYEKIPLEVVDRAKWVLLDSIGCILNGLAGESLPEDTNAAILKCSAAMVSTELYEGNRFAVGHPACHIVPILLAELEKRNTSYSDVLRIFICAYEVASRWGSAVRFSNDMLGHGTIMNVGAAVVEGLLENLGEDEFVNYIMTCEALPEVSTWQSVFEGSALHDFYPGIAAVNAKNALYMTSNKVRSSEELIRSIYSKIEGTCVMTENLSKDITDNWYLLKNYFKVHSGCRFIHPFADVIETMMKEGLTKDNVEEIHVSTYKKAAQISDRKVTNSLAAKFSIPVSLAILLVEGRLYPDNIERAVENNQVRKLAEHIYLTEDEKYNELLPDVRGGLVQVKKKNGEVMEHEVFHAHGDFDDPEGYSEDKLVNKFRNVTSNNLSDKEQNQLIDKVLRGSESLMVSEIFREYFGHVR